MFLNPIMQNDVIHTVTKPQMIQMHLGSLTQSVAFIIFNPIIMGRAES